MGHILGKKVEIDPSDQWLTIDNMTVYREGSIISKANVENDARANIDRLFQLIIRSEQCVGCSLCVARCEQHALYMKDGRVEINPDECIMCRSCLGPCPASSFLEDYQNNFSLIFCIAEGSQFYILSL